jgi:DNA-binding PadR family transcriptional regulator
MDTNRKAKYYKLTAAGRKQLQEAEVNFEQLVKGIRAILLASQCARNRQVTPKAMRASFWVLEALLGKSFRT